MNSAADSLPGRRGYRAAKSVFVLPSAILLAMLWIMQATAAPLWSVNGYLKSYSVVYTLRESQRSLAGIEPSAIGSVSDRLRLDMHYRPTPTVTLQCSYSLVVRVQDAALFGGDLTPRTIPQLYRTTDLDARLYPATGEPASSFGLFENLDRALVTWAAPGFDLRVGRQAITWGAARVMNPTDIVAPYIYSELDTEDRIGVDAIRARVPVGTLNEVDIGYVAGQDFKLNHSALYLRGQVHAGSKDWSVMAAGFRENLLFGLDMAGPIGGFGLWFEAAYVAVDALNGSSPKSEDDYVRVSLGMDHRLGARGYGYLEYHYNGPGADRAEETPHLRQIPYAEGAVYLTGRHYMAPGVTCQVTPLVTVGLSALLNLPDPSALVAPSLEYNIAEDIYLGAGGYIGVGRGMDLDTSGGQGAPLYAVKSEFGQYPGFYYLSFRTYF